MDSPEFPSGKSPRRELLGPRPTPLKVRKDSHKIRKPPVAPPAQHPQPLAQPRQPVIIYTVSPKIIHADPSEFMNLVQRLTGSSSSVAAAAASSSSPFPNTGALSPAARFASTEKTKLSPEKKKNQVITDDFDMIEGVEMTGVVERTGFSPGILSPGPASLPPIPQKFFTSPASDPNPFNTLFHDFSPVLQSSKSYMEGSSNFMMPSPSYFLSPKITSPTTPSLDIFNNFFDF